MKKHWKIFIRTVLVVAAFIVLIWLTGCGAIIKSTETKENSVSMFVVIEQTTSWTIVYHKETKVMYVIKGIFTVLLDADGKPLLYEEESSYIHRVI